MTPRPPLWNFSENSSVLVAPLVPKDWLQEGSKSVQFHRRPGETGHRRRLPITGYSSSHISIQGLAKQQNIQNPHITFFQLGRSFWKLSMTVFDFFQLGGTFSLKWYTGLYLWIHPTSATKVAPHSSYWTYPELPSTKNYISNTFCPRCAQPGADERPALRSAASKIYSGNHHNTLCVEYLSENNPKSTHFVWNFHFQNHIERTVYSKNKNCCFS